MSIVQNRTASASDTDILLESFSDEEDSCKKTDDIDDDKRNSSNVSSNDEKLSANNGSSPNDAAEIRRLLRRKDELERKQKMQERYNERLQVSTKKMFYANFMSNHKSLCLI